MNDFDKKMLILLKQAATDDAEAVNSCVLIGEEMFSIISKVDELRDEEQDMIDDSIGKVAGTLIGFLYDHAYELETELMNKMGPEDYSLAKLLFKGFVEPAKRTIKELEAEGYFDDKM